MSKLVLIFLFCTCLLSAQEGVQIDSIPKTNSIIFIEGTVGFGAGKGLLGFLGANINYQFNRTDLITARFTTISGGDFGTVLIAPVNPLPLFLRTRNQYEFGALYGKRWTFSYHSFSVSMGVSHTYGVYYLPNNNTIDDVVESDFGIPFELNLKFFKAKKQRFRAYFGIIPIGKKKISFGRSVGLKLMGNFSKNGWFGMGVTHGFGWHKRY